MNSERLQRTTRAARLCSLMLAALGCALLYGASPVSPYARYHSVANLARPSIGSPAVSFELKTLEGQPITLSSFRGKPLVMNFFATWCDPCREEMPLINELAARGARDGYNVLGIAIEDSRAAVTAYVREAGLVFPVALDLNSTVKRAYRIFGPPATFFIDRQGIVRDVVFGPITRQRANDAMKQLAAAPRRDHRSPSRGMR